MISWRMQPSTPSVLGVIAIVSVMITATLSEAESDGAIEHGINHLAAAQEDRHFPDSESTTNETTAPTSATTTTTTTTTTTPTAITATTTTATTITSTISTITATTTATATDRKPAVIVVKDSATAADLVELPFSGRRFSTAVSLVEPKGAAAPLDSATRQDDRNETALSVEAQGELQRDQSDVRPELPVDLPPELPLDLPPELPDDLRPDPHSDRATLQEHDPRDPRRVPPIDRSALRSPPEDDRNTTPGSLEDFPVSVLSYDESSTRLAPLEYQMMSSSGESSRLEGQRNQSRSTTTEETYLVGTELDDRKAVDDIKAISFQIPAKEREHEDRDEQEKQQQVAKAGVKGDGKKDPARSPNNILLGGGKSTKAFYEIKPSIKTEMERVNEQPSTTTTQWVLLPGRRFVLPSVDSAFGKFGPYFEDGDQEQNITARIGSTVLLDCKIGMLGDKKVTWLQHSKDSFRLLTVGRIPYSVDQRISLNFRYPSNWRLQILYASPRDSGLYKCQVATHPPLVKKINVIVTAPELTITDDAGRIVPKERHLKAGSALRLRCEARDVLESQNESVVWTRGDETLTEDVSENRTSEISASEEVLVIVSTLIVERASPRHAGNYSCEVPGKARTTIAVHVLNGELPAAVHDGNGVSRAVLNLWLIHLTMSYVFSR